MSQKKILLIVGGGIAAYKACELIRLARKADIGVTCVLTEGGAHFVTAMTLAALSENQVHTTLWDLKNEAEMGHIQLSREADLVVVVPGTADLIAKMAGGLASDLATTLLLATDKPVLVAPAMNVRMWQHAATRRNVRTLRGDGVHVMEPDEGAMACGEYGPGRLPEPARILAEIGKRLSAPGPATQSVADLLEGQPDFTPDQHRPLHGRHILVTAGPTHEPIDPVRYIANRSSGKQGFAIAAAAAQLGAEVTLVAGPVNLPTPAGVIRVDVETAREMQAAVNAALPADAAIMVAAVADWRTADEATQKIKKQGEAPPPLALTENPDILAGLAKSEQRPRLLIGFAAETEKLAEHARAKLAKKGCDWIIANDVSGSAESGVTEGVMGSENNRVVIVRPDGEEAIGPAPKPDIARQIMEKIADALD